MENDYYKQYEPFFGSWHIKRFIGAGSYGKVFEIERRDEFDTVYTGALKAITIPSSQSELDEILANGMDREGASTYFRDYVRDLNREIALMSKLKGHSNIVSYEDHALFSHKDGLGWDILIRMELLTPITNYLRQNHSFTRREVINLGIDLCRALEICQKYNIIHRDIKPANIFISDTDDFKLGDFGVARIASASTGASTRAGTINYMAPEVFRGEKYTSNVDIYSLGLVMYQLLNNNRMPLYPPYPQPITPSGREQAQARRLSGAALPLPANADGRLAEIILKACAPSPTDRYESPSVMRQALEAILYTEKEARMIYPEGDAVPVPDTTSSKKSQADSVVHTGNATVGLFGVSSDKNVPAHDAPTERVLVQDTVPDDKTQSLFKSQEDELRRQEEASRAAQEQEAKEAELARIREEKRKAEAERKAAEEAARRKAEQEAKEAELARICEEKRKAEAERKAAEEAARRKAEQEAKEAELARIREEKRKAEAERKAAEKAARRKAEQEAKAAELARLREEKRQAEEKRKALEAELANILKEKRKAKAERKATEESARCKADAELPAESQKPNSKWPLVIIYGLAVAAVFAVGVAQSNFHYDKALHELPVVSSSQMNTPASAEPRKDAASSSKAESVETTSSSSKETSSSSQAAASSSKSTSISQQSSSSQSAASSKSVSSSQSAQPKKSASITQADRNIVRFKTSGGNFNVKVDFQYPDGSTTAKIDLGNLSDGTHDFSPGLSLMDSKGTYTVRLYDDTGKLLTSATFVN